MVDGALGEAALRRGAGAVELIDQAADLARRTTSAMAVLWLTAMPARFALAYLIAQLVRLGPKAHEHGAFLKGIAYAALGLWLVSLWGRQVYVRACRLVLEGGEPRGLAGLRVPLRDLAAATSAALVVELLFWLLSITAVAPVPLLAAAALAATAAPRGGPGLLPPLRALLSSVGSLGTLFFLEFLFLIGLMLAALNLHNLFWLTAWALGPVLPAEAASHATILSLHNPLYAILLVAGATLLIEPLWLAAMTAHVESVRAASSGEDLRQRFAELRARELPRRGAA